MVYKYVIIKFYCNFFLNFHGNMTPNSRLRNGTYGSKGDIDLACYFFIIYNVVTMFQPILKYFFLLNCTFFYQKMYISFRRHYLCASILSTLYFKGKLQSQLLFKSLPTSVLFLFVVHQYRPAY